MAKMKTFQDLFDDELRDAYDFEKQLTKALPKMAKGATSGELREALTSHLEETRTHVTRLEQVFKALGQKPRGKHCAGIAGIIEEGGELLEEDLEDAALDAGIIAGGQRAEHYEIAAYGSLIAWAKTLGLNDAIDLLAENLEEEKAADQKLTELAESGVNESAAANAQGDGQDVNHGARKPGLPNSGRNGRLVATSVGLAARSATRSKTSKK